MVDYGTRHSRSFVGPTAVGYTNGVKTGQTILTGTTEISDSLNHGFFPRLLGSGADIGGAWLMTRDSYNYSLGKILTGQFKGSDSVITGGIGSQSHPDPPSDSSLFPKGAQAISNCIPTNPAFSAVSFMGEAIQDGVPSMLGVETWKHRTRLAQGAGSEYLNYEFGWLPLISDIRKFAKAVKNHDKILRDLLDGSGRSTRVGFAFPSEQTSSSGSTSLFLHKGGNTGVSVALSGSYYRAQTKNTWFRGAFTYHLPVPSDTLGKMQLYAAYADKLLGVKPTPDAIWNATPWTWALDWFSNAGDVINNISRLNQDGLALTYGYLMVGTKSTDSIGTTGNTTWGPAFRTRIREFKKRIPASPYGFGVSDGDLSPRQKAIIVALGLTGGRGGRG
jgi:hypothetical protein